MGWFDLALQAITLQEGGKLDWMKHRRIKLTG